MKKLYFLTFLFLCTFLTIGTNTAWGETAAVGDILWAENFAHFETNTPSDAKTGTGTTIFGGATITYSQSSTSTKGYNEKLAGGTAPELLLAKNNTTWTISGIPTGGATEMQLTFLSNKAAFGLTTTTQNLTISGKEKTWTIQVEEGKTAPETFDITLKNTAKKDNARIDNVSIVVVTAASSVSEKVSLVYNGNGSTGGTVPAPVEYDKGATVTVAGNTGGLVKTGFDFAGWNTLENGSGITYQGGSTFAINANTTLYALWTAQSNKLSTPTNLKTTDITSNSAKLSWDAVPHATKYIVTYAETNSSAIKVDVTSTTYVLSGLPSEATYLWTVKAVGDGTYEDSEESSTADFTTLPTPYTITWSTPDGTSITEVTPGDKVVLPATDPIAPYSCSEKVFVGWSETNIGTIGTDDAPAFITSQTIPNSDITYYAVFATKTTMGGSQDIVFNVKNIAQEKSWKSGTQYSSYTIAPITITYSGGGNDGKYYSSDNSWRSYTGGSVVVSGGTISEVISTPEQTFTKQTDGTWKYTGTETVKFTQFTIKTAVVSSTYTDYVTGCVDCTAPAEALALTLPQETANLGADGTAQISFSTTGGNGAIIDYAINPTIGADLDKTNKTITFSAIGTYTLTASQLYTTTDGTTYCGGKDKKTITVTNTPVLYFPTPTPADPIVFGTVECGGNTPLENKQTINLRGYNLTGDVTVTVTGDYKIADTETAAWANYATSLTLPKDAVSGSSASVYVISTPPMQSSNPTQGKVTFTTAGGNALEVKLSTPIITCTEYTLTLNDRGSKTTLGNYYAGEKITTQPAALTDVCTEPINYIFDGWATAEVAEGSPAYTKVSFPYTMPAANTTLYAVYRYEDNSINDFELVDEVISGRDYIIAADYSDKVYALTNRVDGNNKGVSTEVTCTGSNETGYIITTADENIIWHAEGNSTDGFSLYNAAIDKYLNMSLIKTNYSGLLLSQTGSTKYSFTLVDAQNSSEVTIIGKNFSSAYNKMTFYNNVFQCYNKKSDNPIYIYSRRTDYYTTAPSCTPYIKGTDDITVTSAKGVWVEAVTPLNITATNLDKNADGANVTIAATSLTGGFTLKTQGTNGSGSESVTLETGYSNSTYNANLTVVYSPTADNIIEEGKIALRVYRTYGTTTYATDTVMVRGRSLPAEFVLAAKTANGWVALPADLGTSSTDAVKEPYTISVDDDAAPTKATLAPQSALYSAAMRSTADAIPTGLRFAAGGKYLQGSQSEGETKVWLSSNNNKQMQSWELHSSNLTDYFVRLRAAEEGRYLSYNATQGKIANYKQDSRLRILPVEQTCMRYDAPNIRVHALISTNVTFVWEAIAGVTDYEYSLDGEKTWHACGDIETLGTEVKWTLANLTSETKYTVYIRAKVADGKSNCSASDSETFTTPTCDDVPVDLWVSATANAATIMWSAKAPTATVKIYADEQGTKLVKETPNATTPCKIIGLEQNTDYYYQVLAGGSCASAIAHFKTESNEVSIVEWKKDAVIVDINTEVTDADEVSILVENQHTHGTNNQNIADDLFFSKYYEATGNLKLLGIYNGTKDTLPLTNVKIKIGRTAWGQEVPMNTYGKHKTGYISPDEEIILWHRGTTTLNTCVAEKMDTSIMQEHNNISFSGKASIGLFRADTLIDIIGAGTKNLPKEGTIKPSWGDDPGWSGNGYDIENPSTEIELSTNRCLLVRGNKVKSGRNAVLNNTTTFATFTKDEWLGRQVSMYKEDGTDDKGEESSCNGFAYVADFNYNDYYTTYDSIANLEIKGNRNEDGTYTIPVTKLDTMACTNLRLQLKKNGTIQATREEKVPIIIYTTTDTKNSTFFGGKLTDEICKTCDVVVRDNAQLSHIAGGKQQFRDMYVYTGSSLNIPENQTMSLDKVRMFATNDSVSYAVINNSNDAAAAISVKEVSHVKRIDGRYWYPFSLPYDCNIADIDQLNGQPIGVYGTDWGIKYYDGERRQREGNSTTHYGEVSKYWTMMPEDDVLKAYTGYIIGLFVPAADEPLMKSVNFPPATESAYTENASSKTTPITNWPVNLNAEPRHHGWNFVGSPYISLFGSNNNTQGEGLYNTQVQMGWTDALGNQRDKDNIYVSIPNGGNTNTYTQALASGVTIHPFSAYFVQAIDPTNGQSNTLELRYSKTQRALPTLASARTAKTDALILTELDITNGALGDNTGVLVSNVYSAEYEIGDDLTKMYAAAQKPQLYTIDAHNDKMAYQALPDVLAHAISLGIYVPQAGNYTLSLNRYVSRLEAAEAVYLLHNGTVVANLLLSDYTVAASAKGTVSGYSLDIRRAPEVVTDIVPAAGDAPYIIARDGVLAIANLPADAVVQVYDVLGHRLLQTDTHAAGTLQVPVPQTGVYTVVITTADGQQVLKTLLR